MKKFYLLLLSFIFLSPLNMFADCSCEDETEMLSQSNCNKQCQKTNEQQCPQTYTPNDMDCFLCTNKNMQILFEEIGLSETQICTAMKIQDKYEQEVLSLNESIECEEQNLYTLKEGCSKNNEIRKEKRKIKDLKKKRKEICECYEKQFKALLSDQQKRKYNKYKKSK